jgi:hypothetical protein
MSESTTGGSWKWLGIATVAGILLAFSNPDLDAHKARFRKALVTNVDEKIDQSGFWESLLLSASKDQAIELTLERLTYQNFILLSQTSVTNQGMTFGICGQVFVLWDGRPLDKN